MTDHRAECAGWLEYSTQHIPDIEDSAVHASNIAQVHATLALVDATNAQTAAMERIARAAPSRAVGL